MNNFTIIELIVNNHPGVMSHITGLFSRRNFNIDGILCGRIGDGNKSRIYLLTTKDEKLEQIVKQLMKLYDVLEVHLREDYEIGIFENLDGLFKKEEEPSAKFAK